LSLPGRAVHFARLSVPHFARYAMLRASATGN
jgi:hypothetical protein